MTTITTVLLWTAYWRCVGHTCCCSVAVPLCELILSQRSEVGGKFKKGRERSGKVIQSAVISFVLETVIDILTQNTNRMKMKQEDGRLT